MTDSTQNVIITYEVISVKDFMEYNFDVGSIELCCYVGPGCGTPVHKDRICHGLVFSITDKQVFSFDDGKEIITHENEILYLPKASNYVTGSSKLYSCYAVNFHFFNDITFPPFEFMISLLKQSDFITLTKLIREKKK